MNIRLPSASLSFASFHSGAPRVLFVVGQRCSGRANRATQLGRGFGRLMDSPGAGGRDRMSAARAKASGMLKCGGGLGRRLAFFPVTISVTFRIRLELETLRFLGGFTWQPPFARAWRF